MTGGRPTEYDGKIVDLAESYLLELPKDEKVHSIEGLSDHINIARSTIYKWCKEENKREFSDIVEKILNKQGKTLLNGGLSNIFNASITKLMLTKHGYVDRQETDITTGGDKLSSISPEALAIANKYEEEIKRNL